MGALLVRFLGYVLVVFGARALWQRHRARLILAAKLWLIGWGALFLIRFITIDHSLSQWSGLALGIGSMLLLWAVTWFVTRLIAQRRGRL